jgi:hypothetical protein
LTGAFFLKNSARISFRKLIDTIRVRSHPRMLIGYGLMYLVFAVKRLWVRDYVIVSPTKPRDVYSLWKLARLSGIKMVSEADSHRLPKELILASIRHHDETWDTRVYDGLLNGACTDISKSHVDATFGKVFGYTTQIDPRTYIGRAVMKSEINYSGGGTFIDCPLGEADIKPMHFYQKLVDNKVQSDVVKEYRVSVICGEITDVIVQYRTVERRLTGRGSGGGRGSTITRAEDVFSPSEIAKIREFCALMNLEFGELDVLPDVNEGRLYILDANKTPSYMTQPSAFRIGRFINAWRRARSFRRLLRTRRSLLTTRSADQEIASPLHSPGQPSGQVDDLRPKDFRPLVDERD